MPLLNICYSPYKYYKLFDFRNTCMRYLFNCVLSFHILEFHTNLSKLIRKRWSLDSASGKKCALKEPEATFQGLLQCVCVCVCVHVRAYVRCTCATSSTCTFSKTIVFPCNELSIKVAITWTSSSEVCIFKTSLQACLTKYAQDLNTSWYINSCSIPMLFFMAVPCSQLNLWSWS